MKIRVTLLAFLVLSLTAFVAAATAKTVPITGHSQASVKKACDGAYWPSSVGGTYGCMNKDGSGIVCGGVTSAQKKTCSTFRAAPKGPYRNELQVALSRAHP